MQNPIDELKIYCEHNDGPKIMLFVWGKIGDAVQITPLIRSLRFKFHTSRIILVVESYLTVSMLNSCSHIDKIIVCDSQNHHQFIAECNDFNKIDLYVKCRYVIEYKLGDGYLNFTPEEIDFIEMAQSRQKEWLPLLDKFPFDNDKLWRKAHEHNLNMFSLMSYTSGFEGADFENLFLNTDERYYEILNSLPENFITICNAAEDLPLIAKGWTKCLPEKKIEELVSILKGWNIPLVQIGVMNDPKIIGVDYDLRGKSSVGQVAAILKRSLFHIGPEGGLANIARAVGKKSIVFFGSTPPEFFAFKENINILPKVCGKCWWITDDYLYNCPNFSFVPDCVNSIDLNEIKQAGNLIINSQVRKKIQCENFYDIPNDIDLAMEGFSSAQGHVQRLSHHLVGLMSEQLSDFNPENKKIAMIVPGLSLGLEILKTLSGFKRCDLIVLSPSSSGESWHPIPDNVFVQYGSAYDLSCEDHSIDLLISFVIIPLTAVTLLKSKLADNSDLIFFCPVSASNRHVLIESLANICEKLTNDGVEHFLEPSTDSKNYICGLRLSCSFA